MKTNQIKNATVLQRAVVEKKEIRIEMPSQKEVVVDNNKQINILVSDLFK